MKTVLRFTAEWCGPCKVYAPIFDKVLESKDGIEVQVVDVDKQPDLASKYRVMSIPATVLLENGEELDRKVGAMPASILHKFLDQ